MKSVQCPRCAQSHEVTLEDCQVDCFCGHRFFFRSATAGRKQDDGKPDWSLIPKGTMRHVVAVLTHGKKKYARENWQHVPEFKERYYSALRRHLDAWWDDGEWIDEDSGCPHLACVACNALFLLWGGLRDEQG